MSDDGPDYEAVVPEKLRLKGVSLKKSKKSKKRKDKKEKRRGKRARTEEGDADAAAALAEDSAEAGAGEREKEEDGDQEEPEDTRTEAQKRFEKVQRKRMRRTVQQMAAKTHRQKVDEFNEYLGKLSEHHDIPKVASAGNG